LPVSGANRAEGEMARKRCLADPTACKGSIVADTASFPPYLAVKCDRGFGAARWLQVPMFRRIVVVIFIWAGSFAMSSSAFAHPHVWVTMHTDLLYAADGSVTGVRQTWTFDDMFSAFATMGFPKTNGTFARSILQPLAKVNVDSLQDFDYFTYATIDGKRVKDAFNDPLPDYWLDYDAKTTLLTLHFTLPFKTPVKTKSLQIEVYDPTFFIDFAMAKTEPVALVGAPAQCKVATEKPPDINFPTTLQLDQALVTSEENVGMGASFANKITVTCP
jgi:ABC-type uncharacterized transport system substrate-binding protein